MVIKYENNKKMAPEFFGQYKKMPPEESVCSLFHASPSGRPR
jgi:hypothetical protein